MNKLYYVVVKDQGFYYTKYFNSGELEEYYTSQLERYEYRGYVTPEEVLTKEVHLCQLIFSNTCEKNIENFIEIFFPNGLPIFTSSLVGSEISDPWYILEINYEGSVIFTCPIHKDAIPIYQEIYKRYWKEELK